VASNKQRTDETREAYLARRRRKGELGSQHRHHVFHVQRTEPEPEEKVVDDRQFPVGPIQEARSRAIQELKAAVNDNTAPKRVRRHAKELLQRWGVG
jgi:hypothetical protein